MFAVLLVLISLLTVCLTTTSPIAAICGEIGCGDGGGAVRGCNVDDVDGGDAGGLFACCVICDVYLLMSGIVACCVKCDVGLLAILSVLILLLTACLTADARALPSSAERIASCAAPICENRAFLLSAGMLKRDEDSIRS